jgi:hypothetical protein
MAEAVRPIPRFLQQQQQQQEQQHQDPRYAWWACVHRHMQVHTCKHQRCGTNVQPVDWDMPPAAALFAVPHHYAMQVAVLLNSMYSAMQAGTQLRPMLYSHHACSPGQHPRHHWLAPSPLSHLCRTCAGHAQWPAPCALGSSRRSTRAAASSKACFRQSTLQGARMLVVQAAVKRRRQHLTVQAVTVTPSSSRRSTRAAASSEA